MTPFSLFHVVHDCLHLTPGILFGFFLKMIDNMPLSLYQIGTMRRCIIVLTLATHDVQYQIVIVQLWTF